MDKVAGISADDRKDLFQETAARRGMHPAIAEKDFWVCWILKQIFTDQGLKDKLIFKGGTSLSKVYHLIERFSEDIDLVLDWRVLGYGKEQEDPFKEFESNARRGRFYEQMNARAGDYIETQLVPQLNQLFAKCSGISASGDGRDHQIVNIVYPSVFSLEYLRPEVQLEIGPLASWVPNEHHIIKPYAAEEFPKVFDDPDCPVFAISAERTFWEKATILHQQAHRQNSMPARYSRHYYDFYKLSRSPVKEAALKDGKLLQDVVEFKQRFYPSAWAKYENAKPGSFKLLPNEACLAEIGKDYDAMGEMIFGDRPDLDLMMGALGELEQEINELPYSE